MPNHSLVIKTNTTHGSIVVVKKHMITFHELLDNYPSKSIVHKIDKEGNDFSNACAIKLSDSLYKCGVLLKAFPKHRKCWGCPIPDKNGKGIHAIAAQDLADYLKKRPFAGCPDPKYLDASDFYDEIEDKNGIIFFKDFWVRGSDQPERRTGDHIDLWSKNELVSIGGPMSWIRQTFPNLSESFGMSNLARSSEILYWEIK